MDRPERFIPKKSWYPSDVWENVTGARAGWESWDTLSDFPHQSPISGFVSQHRKPAWYPGINWDCVIIIARLPAPCSHGRLCLVCSMPILWLVLLWSEAKHTKITIYPPLVCPLDTGFTGRSYSPECLVSCILSRLCDVTRCAFVFLSLKISLSLSLSHQSHNHRQTC